MNRSTALAKLTKLFGPKLAYEESPDALPREEREARRVELRDVHARIDAAQEALVARSKELLAADERYQQLRHDIANLRPQRDALSSKVHRHRVTVGVITSQFGFFEIKVQADNWQEAVELAQKLKG